MGKIHDGNMSRKEFAAIVFFMIGIKFKDSTPDLFYSIANNAAWMMPIFSLIIFIVPLWLLLSLLTKHRLGLSDLIFKLTGNYVGTIIVSFLFLIFFSGTINNFRGHIEIVNTLVFHKTPIAVIFFIFILVSFYIAYRGFEAIGRVSWLVFTPLQIFMLLLIILSWEEINWGFLFPIAGPGLMKIMKESIKHSSMFSEIILLAAFYPFLRSAKDFRYGSIGGVAFSIFQVSLFLILLLLVFDYPGVDRMSFPYQQLTRYITIGGVVSHVEGVFLGFWSVVSAIHFAIYLLLSASLFSSVLRLQEGARLLIPLAGLVFFVGLLPENAFTTLNMREWLAICASWTLIVTPVLLWGLDKWKGRLQK